MDIKFDQATFDIVLKEDGEMSVDLDFITDTDKELMQRLFLRLKTFQRDLFWNTKYGIDYIKDVFGKSRGKSTVDILLKNEINKESMVAEIKSFESEVGNYSYACKFSVRAVNETKTISYYILTNEDGVILTDSNGDRLTSRI